MYEKYLHYISFAYVTVLVPIRAHPIYDMERDDLTPEEAYERYVAARLSREIPALDEPVPEPETPEHAAYVELFGKDDATERNFTEYYVGTYETLSDFVRQVLEDMDAYSALEAVNLPEDIKKYATFDLDAIGQDWFLSGDIAICHLDGGKLAVFRNH